MVSKDGNECDRWLDDNWKMYTIAKELKSYFKTMLNYTTKALDELYLNI